MDNGNRLTLEMRGYWYGTLPARVRLAPNQFILFLKNSSWFRRGYGIYTRNTHSQENDLWITQSAIPLGVLNPRFGAVESNVAIANA